MRRRISLLLAALLAGGTLTLLAPAPPASAWIACAGTGNAAVTPGLLYPVAVNIGTGANLIEVLIGKANDLHSFTFGSIVGGCVHPPSTAVPQISAAGVLKGYCGHSVGTGTVNGQLFAYVSVGGTLLLTGHLVGIANAAPTPGTGSCLHAATPVDPTFGLPGGAAQFLINAAGIGFNCAADLTTLGTGLLPGDTEFLTRIIDIDTLVSPVIHVSIHLGVHFWYNRLCVGSPVL
jgi:hypothetical protein